MNTADNYSEVTGAFDDLFSGEQKRFLLLNNSLDTVESIFVFSSAYIPVKIAISRDQKGTFPLVELIQEINSGVEHDKVIDPFITQLELRANRVVTQRIGQLLKLELCHRDICSILFKIGSRMYHPVTDQEFTIDIGPLIDVWNEPAQKIKLLKQYTPEQFEAILSELQKSNGGIGDYSRTASETTDSVKVPIVCNSFYWASKYNFQRKVLSLFQDNKSTEGQVLPPHYGIYRSKAKYLPAWYPVYRERDYTIEHIDSPQQLFIEKNDVDFNYHDSSDEELRTGISQVYRLIENSTGETLHGLTVTVGEEGEPYLDCEYCEFTIDQLYAVYEWMSRNYIPCDEIFYWMKCAEKFNKETREDCRYFD